ncbi:MAG: tetratricopeptide repeat protein [Candidatus Nealsonbacteria bacterium]|nr:tetratricopeptide repeat protein [Candidatus Nealsonbacteria bacterium]
MRSNMVQWTATVALSVAWLCAPASAQDVTAGGVMTVVSDAVAPETAAPDAARFGNTTFGNTTPDAAGPKPMPTLPDQSATNPIAAPADEPLQPTFQPTFQPTAAPSTLYLRAAEEPSATVAPDTPDTGAEQPLEPIPEATSAGPVEIEAASFKGVEPGITTLAQVGEAWGAPREMRKQDANTLVQLYAVEPFEQVEVTYFKETVASVIIRFNRAFAANAIAQQLELTAIRPVLISNDLGDILGQVYPERGVLFSFLPAKEAGKATMQVGQIILESVTAEPFVLRAETVLETQPELSRRDLEQALKLQPDNARAHWLLCRVLVAIGEPAKAEAAGTRAVELEPGNARYRITRAQLLAQQGRLAEAVRETRQAIEASQKRPHVEARALCLMGDLVASGSRPDYKRAIQYHIEAVSSAGKLATSRHPAVRLAAKEVLINAHLGAAHDVAWGSWKEKNKAVTRWLAGAEAVAAELVDNEGGSPEHQFRVNTRALAACVGVRGELEPGKWTREAIRTGEELIAQTTDPVRKAQYQWDLGLALYDALQVYQMRDDHETALKYGERAIDFLEMGDRHQDMPGSAYLVGRLYFRLGAIHAIRDENHRAAITWFDKAVPLLNQPIPRKARADLGRHGETFVSMGVSYWNSGQRNTAVQLTQIGIDLMEQAVEQGLLAKSALVISYDNLSSMLRQNGEDDKADRFEAMADRAKHTTTR